MDKQTPEAPLEPEMKPISYTDTLSATGMAWNVLVETIMHPLQNTKVEVWESEDKGNGEFKPKKRRYVVRTVKE